MAWYLNRALTNFREAVNRAYPHRDKASDGTIGDEAHQSRTSDHNEDPDGSVDAWDMDVEVNGKGKPYAEDIEHLKRVFQAHPSSRYWIHNRQIASRDIDNWRRRPYDGDNPHTQHVHWNTRESHEDSNAPWIIEEDDVTPEQAKQLDRIEAHVTATANRVFTMMLMRHEARYKVPGESAERVEPNYMGYVVNDTLRILTGVVTGAEEVAVHDKDGRLSLAPLYARLADDVDEQAVANHLAPLIQSGVSMEQVVAAVRQVLREAAARVAA